MPRHRYGDDALSATPPAAVRLYRCASCDRLAPQPQSDGAPCHYCGGPLQPMWGLAQLATARHDHDAPGARPASPGTADPAGAVK